MEDFTNRMKNINSRIDELHKKMDFNLFEIKKVNTTFKQIKHSYLSCKEPNGSLCNDATKQSFVAFEEKNQETFAGNPLKMIQKTHHYR